MELFKDFRFEAAHDLPNMPMGHKCRRLHGHSYLVRVTIEGPVSPMSGIVMDFADISDEVKPIIERLDHYYLNEIEGLANPTSEVLAQWLFERIENRVPQLVSVEVRETCTSGCIYRGD